MERNGLNFGSNYNEWNISWRKYMIQKIDYNKENRVETGAVQFGNDWPGLFIRGDDCIFLSESLKFKLDP